MEMLPTESLEVGPYLLLFHMSSIQDRLLAAVAENAQLKSDAAALTKRLNKAEKKTNGVEATTKKVSCLLSCVCICFERENENEKKAGYPGSTLPFSRPFFSAAHAAM